MHSDPKNTFSQSLQYILCAPTWRLWHRSKQKCNGNVWRCKWSIETMLLGATHALVVDVSVYLTCAPSNGMEWHSTAIGTGTGRDMCEMSRPISSRLLKFGTPDKSRDMFTSRLHCITQALSPICTKPLGGTASQLLLVDPALTHASNPIPYTYTPHTSVPVPSRVLVRISQLVHTAPQSSRKNSIGAW